MLRSPKILVVDDEFRLCESLSYLLTAKSYDVTTANCGWDGMALASETKFDLAILDVHLKDMLGTEIMNAIKMRHPDTLVIIITGDADLDSAIAALKCGAYDYMRKPFEFEELLNTVENALNQKALEREKEEINEKLYLSEKKYRHLVQNSPDIIYTLDAEGKFTFLSEAVEHLLGFMVTDLLGKHYTMIVCEEDQEKTRWFFDERRSRERATSGIELQLKINEKRPVVKGDSPYLIVELKSMGIYEKSEQNGGRKHIGTHGVIRDISERQRIQVKLQNVERMESLGTLAGGIAHDFNNLLMGIQGRSSLISMDVEKTNLLEEHLQAIDEYINSASHLTKQLLGFARGGKYEVKPTDMNMLILNSAKMFGRTKKEIVIETKFHKSTIAVAADRRQIEQVLLNLYVNAWQAMPDGGTLRIETKAVVLDEKACRPYQVQPGGYVQVLVTDSGMGMDEKTLHHIFDPFFTTKEKSRGTGLGLASAYGIVKNHGGIITASSKVDIGSTFNIFLPLCEQAVVEEISKEPEVSHGSETVLLVDDEEMILDVGKALLEKLGYHVITANSGEKAIDIVCGRGTDIDLVVLDMIMPGMDGGKTFDRIRDLCPSMPVVLSSGYAINGQAEEIMRRGCNGFIQKPFTVYVLSQKIRKVLDAARPAFSDKSDLFESLPN